VPAPPSPAALRGLNPLLQRDRELAVLDASLDEAVSGRGGIGVVTGPLGIGKSALLAAVRDRARSRGVTVLTARGAPLERDYGYAVVRRLFEPLGLEAGTPTDPALLIGAATLATRAFAPAGRGASSEDGAFATVHGLYWLTANLAARSPVLLVVDDCHWADAPSLRFLAYLGARLEELGVLLLVALRTGEVATAPDLLAEVIALPRTATVRPQPLSAEAAVSLIRGVVGTDVTESFGLACHRATGGNPLLLLALVRSLEHPPPTEAAVEAVATFGAGSVAEVLNRQLARLPAGAARLATSLAVLGPGAGLRHVAALSDMDAESAAVVIDAMRAAGVLSAEDSLDFAHPVFRAAVADGLAPTERALAHQRAAGILADDGAAPERRAVHLLHTLPRASRDTVETLWAAARLATDRGAPETAAVYLRRALDEPAGADDRGPLQADLGLALMARREPEAPELLREAVARTDVKRRPAAALRAARALGVAGYFDDAADFDWVLADAGATDDVTRLLEAETLAGSWLVAARVPAALERCRRYDARTLPDDPGGRMLLVNLVHRSLLVPEPAAPAVEQLRRAFGSGDLLREESLVHVFLAMNLIMADEFALAEQVCTACIGEGQRRGSPSIVASFAFPRALAALRRGALADAEADARWSLEYKLAMGPAAAPAWPLGFLVETLIARGDLTGAEDAIVRTLPADRPPEMMGWALAQQAKGRLRLAQGRHREARADLLDAGERWARLACHSPTLATWRGDTARILALAGDRTEARRLADEQLDLARATHLPRVIANALRDVAAVGPADARLPLLGEAIDLLRDGPAALDRAHALVDHGTALRKAGRRAEAREPLREGLDLAHRAGATPLAERAHAELVAAGARPRRHAATGLDALTASERRVATLAADGLTNREIAERLFVTQRTVETHLQHAFGKLNVHRRDDLPAALTRDGAER
jgi:DNA-binding CsgD family transcriptional regulator